MTERWRGWESRDRGIRERGSRRMAMSNPILFVLSSLYSLLLPYSSLSPSLFLFSRFPPYICLSVSYYYSKFVTLSIYVVTDKKNRNHYIFNTSYASGKYTISHPFRHFLLYFLFFIWQRAKVATVMHGTARTRYVFLAIITSSLCFCIVGKSKLGLVDNIVNIMSTAIDKKVWSYTPVHHYNNTSFETLTMDD